MKGLLLLPLIVTGCGAMPYYSTPSTIVPKPTLEQVVEEVWDVNEEPRQENVTWVMDYPENPDFAAVTWAGCSDVRCEFVITVHPDYVNHAVIAHEGGHVVCNTRWWDFTEECANRIAEEKGYQQPG
jgi:hypothetical protein